MTSLSLLTAVIVTTPCLMFLVVAVYVIWLHRAPALAAPVTATEPDWPQVDVIVATFNERPLLDTKLENLARLAYPRNRVRFLIVDGASTDGSHDLIAAWPDKDDRFVALAAERDGKAGQLNLALRHARAPWIVVTDADSRMPAGTLLALMTAARDHPALGVIGSPVLPVTAHPIEQLYWQLLNWLRLCEWRRGSASIVVAPCYAFRRALLHQLADDAVADDVHVAWRIGSMGHPIGIAGPVVEEVRGPRTLSLLFHQKVRRAGGILKEAQRFATRADDMVLPLRAGFAVRLALLLMAPLLVASGVLAAAAAAAWVISLDSASAPAATAAVVAVCVRSVAGRAGRPVGLVVLLAWAATVSVVMYPFVRPAPPPGGAPHPLLRKAR